ncbi:hypothetical protein [Tabrizicola sp.]|uniref:hypothetical protein n=1 Tax=Tabrizicola sp. TaxID=2005166 RepID=UPI00286D1939|nr:hypothetical protein [Tabrizicola sp.]
MAGTIASADVVGKSIRLSGAKALAGSQMAALLVAHLKRPVSGLPGFAPIWLIIPKRCAMARPGWPVWA